MGGCASRPKDLDINEPAPVKAPVVDQPESVPVAQENNGGEETKTEEPLVDLSEPTGETEQTSEAKPAEEVVEVAEDKTETVEAKAEVVEAETETVEAKAEAVNEVKAEVQPTVEVAPQVEVVAASDEPEKTPEGVKEETKAVEAEVTEVKSDAPLVTV